MILSQKGHTMIYEVEGKTKRSNLALLDEVLLFTSKYLGIQETAMLTVKFSNKFDDDVCGYCDELDIEEEWVELEINNKLDKETMLTTIMHEMVHVHQILKGRLVQGNPSTWDGVEYKDEYCNLPWEIEAYALEEKMVKEFKSNG